MGKISGKTPMAGDIFAILRDSDSVKILRSAESGFRARGGIAGKLQITKKQYSTRMHKLVHAGLIHKRNGVYVLTALGEVVDKIILKVADDAITHYWKLKAIDAFDKKNMPPEERRKIIDSLLSDTIVKQYLR